MKEARLMQGNEACAEGAIAAGVRFFAGYPITPSTEVAETMAKLLPQHGGKFVQMEDEIASFGAVLGASLAGMKAMDATSGPGFSLKQELIGYAACAEIPAVLVDVQRVGPSTGQPTATSQGDVMQARWGTHGDHPMITLAPWTVRETFDATVMAVNYAERFRTPVILLMDETVGHLRENVELPDDDEIDVYPRRKPKKTRAEGYEPYAPDTDLVPNVADFGLGYHIHVTEAVDAFTKLAFEAQFQALSPGGAISYVEVPDMQNNIDAVLEVIRFIYDHIMYAELNTKSDYCQVCGYDGEIQVVEDDGKLVWECPKCHNRDQSKMNVARRTCGYIGTQFWNQGRTQEIRERVLHL